MGGAGWDSSSQPGSMGIAGVCCLQDSVPRGEGEMGEGFMARSTNKQRVSISMSIH